MNARHVKNVKGHKTDVVDCKWLQLLHSIGLLSNSFQPDVFTKELRQYTRHRRSLIETSSKYLVKMNKSLVLMNIQLKTVLRNLQGESGLKVIDAIVNGERNPDVLEKLVGKSVKASRKDIRDALLGDWRNEHLFELSQNYSLYKFTWEKIRKTDKQIESLLLSWEKENGDEQKKNEASKIKNKRTGRNAPEFNVNSFAFQMTGGVDLTQIEGVSVMTLLTLMSETGFNLKSKFKTPKHFASWLGYSPNRKITGGKTISSHTQTVQ